MCANLDAPRMQKLFLSVFSFVVCAVARPITSSITVAMSSGPGEPDLSYPRLISKIGIAVAILGYVLGLAFATSFIRSLPRHFRSAACFLMALAIAGIPYLFVMAGGPANFAGDGGPNFIPLFIIIGGGVTALPFLLWSHIYLVPPRPDDPNWP